MWLYWERMCFRGFGQVKVVVLISGNPDTSQLKLQGNYPSLFVFLPINSVLCTPLYPPPPVLHSSPPSPFAVFPFFPTRPRFQPVCNSRWCLGDRSTSVVTGITLDRIEAGHLNQAELLGCPLMQLNSPLRADNCCPIPRLASPPPLPTAALNKG